MSSRLLQDKRYQYFNLHELIANLSTENDLESDKSILACDLSADPSPVRLFVSLEPHQNSAAFV